MGTIKFAPGEDIVLTESSVVPGVKVRHVFGGPSELELFEVHRPPHTVSEAHAHDEDEIIYILEGSLVFGNRTFGPGTAVMVPAWTLYGFRVGEEGVRFANFRPRSTERALVTKDELMAERRDVVDSEGADGQP
jgi:hypothetical protein